MTVPLPALAALVTAASLLLLWLVARLHAAHRRHHDLERRLAAAEALLPEMQGALQQRETLLAVQQEKLATLGEARDAMRTEFKLLAEEAMQRQGEVFGRQNREQIGTILGPLREKLVEFQQGLQAAHAETGRERATLAEQIRQLAERSAHISTETGNLTRALRGQVRVQGAWGEMVLAGILDRSGLRRGEDFAVQESVVGDDGQRLRPDVVVRLPDSKSLVIDAKVSLTAFEAHVNAEDDAERERHMVQHLVSLRAHIRGLSDKDYAAAVGSRLDYVVMFVPIEGALAAALAAEPGLLAFAAERNVAIATPATLMAMLRTVEAVWRVERQHRNAEEIARRGGLLYDKFVGFAEDMEKLGKSIEGVAACHRAAMAKLSRGPGNLSRQIEQLRELGARTGKTLPPRLLDDAAE